MLRSVIMALILSITLSAPLRLSDQKAKPIPHYNVKSSHLPRIPRAVHKEFAPYVKLFLHEGKRYHRTFVVKNLIVKFGDARSVPQKKKGYVTVGYCENKRDGILKIVIDKELWTKYSYAKREMLIFHELSHCLMDSDHRDELDPEGKPLSLMNSVIFSDYQYTDNRDYYLKELFTQ